LDSTFDVAVVARVLSWRLGYHVWAERKRGNYYLYRAAVRVRVIIVDAVVGAHCLLERASEQTAQASDREG
jgi:hypothetical protein